MTNESNKNSELSQIRNFCIIAHIDHGKSTLADRMLEITNTVEKRQMKAQLLDKMDIERERGITIKLAPVKMKFKSDGQEYNFHLIDTPGHVDFTYEVSRSLEACEGAILLIDASQGIQAQTLANLYLAMGSDLTIIPVLNKIDLPAADPERVSAEIIKILGCKQEDILRISAKTGAGVEDLLKAVVTKIPSPKVPSEDKLKALIFDSYYDEFRGVVLYVRIFEGALRQHDEMQMLGVDSKGQALEVGFLSPEMRPSKVLQAGEIGYIVTNLHSTRDAKVGDTVSLTKDPCREPLAGYQEVKPFVYAGFFPSSNEKYQLLKDAIEKLTLSDSALQFSLENSPVLGFGVRIGFLGLLHLDIIRERLTREYGLDLIVTNPSSDYHVIQNNGEELDIKSAAELPDMSKVAEIHEPWIRGEVVTPKDYVGGIISLIVSKRGIQKGIEYIDEHLSVISFDAPLANLLTDFYDQLKSISSGYASLSYDVTGYRAEDLVRVDFYVAGDMVDALSVIVHRSESLRLGREIVKKLKDIIPRQAFQVSLQAAVGAKFIAREDLSAFRKDVTGYLYGGDVSRKKKLLEKQKKGKERMKRFGKVDIPADAFTVLIKRD